MRLEIQTNDSNKWRLWSNVRAYERKRIHSKSKRNFKSSGGNIKSEDHGYRTQGEADK